MHHVLDRGKDSVQMDGAFRPVVIGVASGELVRVACTMHTPAHAVLIGSGVVAAGAKCGVVGVVQASQMTKVVRKGWAVAGLPDVANGWQAGAPGSALLAMRAHHIVQRFVCLASLRQVSLSFSICQHARSHSFQCDFYVCLHACALQSLHVIIMRAHIIINSLPHLGASLLEHSAALLHFSRRAIPSFDPAQAQRQYACAGPAGGAHIREVPADASDRGGCEGARGEGGCAGGHTSDAALQRVLHARPGAHRSLCHCGPPGGVLQTARFWRTHMLAYKCITLALSQCMRYCSCFMACR